ncbi:MAG: Lrp/AsnC family transcriptional regulator [Alphaproteobacteria bacterium]|nr:Lrp/AsnC family transcriptional regulator [Alphaproteobacteria bacterium]
MTIDEFDRKILHHLQSDASLPAEAIGEKIGLSRNACWRRIKRLEDQGLITGRVALLDRQKLNLGLTVFIAVRTRSHSAQWLDQFKEATRVLSEVTGVFRMSGETDYLLRASVPNMAAYDALYQRLISKVELTDVSSSFVMEEIKDTTQLPLGYL